MRFSEIVSEGTGSNPEFAKVVTAISAMRNEVLAKNLKPEISTDRVIATVRNTGLTSFSYQDLLAANDAEPSMKNLVKNISPESITLATGTDQSADNPSDLSPNDAENPEQTVSNMAKSAAARRQKPLF